MNISLLPAYCILLTKSCITEKFAVSSSHVFFKQAYAMHICVMSPVVEVNVSDRRMVTPTNLHGCLGASTLILGE